MVITVVPTATLCVLAGQYLDVIILEFFNINRFSGYELMGLESGRPTAIYSPLILCDRVSPSLSHNVWCILKEPLQDKLEI